MDMAVLVPLLQPGHYIILHIQIGGDNFSGAVAIKNAAGDVIEAIGVSGKSVKMIMM
jgi:uncharacterized protein GlcG (DUF336 family)